MGVKTRKFGPVTWLFLEALAKYFDDYIDACGSKISGNTNPRCAEEMRDLFREFLFLLGQVIPCVYCRVSYREFTYALQPANKYCDVNRILMEKSGGKRFVYHLHHRVSIKLRDQEREQFKNTPGLLREVNKKWKDHMISYDKALLSRFPEIMSEEFWKATIWFLAYVMCDWRKEEACYIHRVFWLLGNILLRSPDPEIATIANRYLKAFQATQETWKSNPDLNTRLDLVWSIQKELFPQKKWTMGMTHVQFLEQCRAAIVGCKTDK